MTCIPMPSVPFSPTNWLRSLHRMSCSHWYQVGGKGAAEPLAGRPLEDSAWEQHWRQKEARALEEYEAWKEQRQWERREEEKRAARRVLGLDEQEELPRKKPREEELEQKRPQRTRPKEEEELEPESPQREEEEKPKQRKQPKKQPKPQRNRHQQLSKSGRRRRNQRERRLKHQLQELKRAQGRRPRKTSGPVTPMAPMVTMATAAPVVTTAQVPPEWERALQALRQGAPRGQFFIFIFSSCIVGIIYFFVSHSCAPLNRCAFLFVVLFLVSKGSGTPPGHGVTDWTPPHATFLWTYGPWWGDDKARD